MRTQACRRRLHVPTNTSDGINFDISRAETLASGAAVSPSLPTHISALAALCAADELMAEPTAEPTPPTLTPRPSGANGGQVDWKAEGGCAMGGCDFIDSGRAAAARLLLTLPSTDCTRPTDYI